MTSHAIFHPEDRDDLFPSVGSLIPSDRIALPNADIEFYPDFIPFEVREKIFGLLLSRIDWKQEQIKYFGKVFDLPRLTAWYGDPGIVYTYSRIQVEAQPWLPILARIRDKIHALRGDKLNCVLLNLYRDQKDSVSWHSDDEPELGEEPAIASISLGETRTFQLRHKTRKDLPTQKIELTSGSLLIMRGATQHHWQHQIPKVGGRRGKRINLTYRNISTGD